LSFAPVAGASQAPRIELVRCGIRALGAPVAGLDVHARHGLPPVPLLLYVGQLADEKGLPFLFQALVQLRQSAVAFRLLLVGEGSRRAHYEREIERLGIQEQCVFVGVIAQPEQLAAYFRAASLFVFPSRFETQGLVVMEAASVGLSTLGLRGAPGVSEQLIDGVNGFLVEPDVSAYAARIASLLADPEQRRQVGERARGLVRTEREAGAEIVELYRDLLGFSRARATARAPHGLARIGPRVERLS